MSKYTYWEAEAPSHMADLMAQWALARLEKELALPWVRVGFFTPARFLSSGPEVHRGDRLIQGYAASKGLDGLVLTARIWVLAGLSPEAIVHTIAHEARHVFQVFTGLCMDRREEDANAFAADFCRRHNIAIPSKGDRQNGHLRKEQRARRGARYRARFAAPEHQHRGLSLGRALPAF